MRPGPNLTQSPGQHSRQVQVRVVSDMCRRRLCAVEGGTSFCTVWLCTPGPQDRERSQHGSLVTNLVHASAAFRAGDGRGARGWRGQGGVKSTRSCRPEGTNRVGGGHAKRTRCAISRPGEPGRMRRPLRGTSSCTRARCHSCSAPARQGAKSLLYSSRARRALKRCWPRLAWSSHHAG